MKESILNALKAKFTGVNATILDRIASRLAKTITKEDEVTTAVEGVTFQQVLDSYGDSRATEASQTAVRRYEEKYNLKEGKIVKQEGNTQQEGMSIQDDTPAWAKALVDANKALTERINAMEGDRLINTRKAKLAEIINKLPENMRKGYSRTSVDKLSEDEFSQLVEDVTNEVNEIINDTNARGAAFGAPKAHAGRASNNDKLTPEQEKAIAQRGGGVVQEGQFF